MYGSKLKSRKKKNRPNLGRNDILLKYHIEETLYQSVFEVRPTLLFKTFKKYGINVYQKIKKAEKTRKNLYNI